MAKKDFSSGLDALLGRDYDEKRSKKDQNTLDEIFEDMHKGKESKPKIGRPVTSTREITKSSQEGTKENETRATFVMREDTVEKIKAIAYWERKMIKEVVENAFREFIDKHEKKNGKIEPTPNK